MAQITFKEALDKSIEEQPEMGTYIHFCRVLCESDASKSEIIKLFEDYMPDDEYDIFDKRQLIAYLAKIAKNGVKK